VRGLAQQLLIQFGRNAGWALHFSMFASPANCFSLLLRRAAQGSSACVSAGLAKCDLSAGEIYLARKHEAKKAK